MQYAYCHKCDDEVEVRIEKTTVPMKIGGIEFTYEAEIPICIKCCSEAYDATLDTNNVKKGHEAYLAAKAAQTGQPVIRCKDCGRTPNQILEYMVSAKEDNMTPDEYVKSEEGTYNPETGQFYCTNCYIKRGMPSGKA